MSARTLDRRSVGQRPAWAGPLRDTLPIILTLAPVGLALGQAIASTTVPALTGWMTAPLLFGASAQLAAVTTMSAGAASSSVVISVAIVNSRALFYSAGLRSLLHKQPRWFRVVAPYFLVDPLFALVTAEHQARLSPREFRRYYLVAAGAIWATWLPLVAAGMVVGPALPGAAILRFAVPALLLGLLAPTLRSRSTVTAAAVAGVVVVLVGPLHGFALVVGAAVGAGVGTMAEWRRNVPCK